MRVGVDVVVAVNKQEDTISNPRRSCLHLTYSITFGKVMNLTILFLA